MSEQSLSKSERLRSFGAIRRLFAEGQGGFIYPFRYMVYAESAEAMEVEVLFSTPKRFLKRANKRNKVRRRMREAYRLNRTLLAEPRKTGELDIALIYSSKEVLDYNTIENAIKRILQKIAEGL